MGPSFFTKSSYDFTVMNVVTLAKVVMRLQTSTGCQEAPKSKIDVSC